MDLKVRWLNFCNQLKAKKAEEIWNWIETRYSEPHRHYHNLTHLEHCFQELDRVRAQPPEIELAIWFHDIIYDTHALDNEEKSGLLVEQAIDLMSLPNGYKYFTVPLILASKTHQGDAATSMFLDIDLSILGQPQEIYDQYEQNIRKEYKWVPWSAYCEGRSKVLQKFLDQEHIYKTKEFQEKCEDLAKINLHRALKSLTEKVEQFTN